MLVKQQANEVVLKVVVTVVVVVVDTVDTLVVYCRCNRYCCTSGCDTNCISTGEISKMKSQNAASETGLYMKRADRTG